MARSKARFLVATVAESESYGGWGSVPRRKTRSTKVPGMAGGVCRTAAPVVGRRGDVAPRGYRRILAGIGRGRP